MRHMQFTIIGVGKKEVKKGGARVSRDGNELLPAMTTLLPQKYRSRNKEYCKEESQFFGIMISK